MPRLTRRQLQRRRRSRAVDWARLPLGEVSDSQLARELGLNPHQVAYARQRLGIPPAPRGVQEITKGLRAPVRRSLWEIILRHVGRLRKSFVEILDDVRDDYGSVCEVTVRRALAELVKIGALELHVGPNRRHLFHAGKSGYPGLFDVEERIVQAVREGGIQHGQGSQEGQLQVRQGEAHHEGASQGCVPEVPAPQEVEVAPGRLSSPTRWTTRGDVSSAGGAS